MVLHGDMCLQYKHICELLFSVQIVLALETVRLLNPPKEPVLDYTLEVLYSCDVPAIIELDCTVTFDIGDSSMFLLKRWHCIPEKPRKKILKLSFPDWLVYRPDGIVSESRWVLICILRASLRNQKVDSGRLLLAKQHVATLQPRSIYSRPVKQHRLCFAWSARMLSFVRNLPRKQCPVEQETVPLLSSIFASTGENFGIIKNLEPYNSDVLEYLRGRSLTFPWSTFSVWILVTRHCRESLCGVFHHIDSQNNFATPVLLLTQSGQLHVQLHGEPGESTAFLVQHEVPLEEWCRITIMLQGREVTITTVCFGKEGRTVKSTEKRLSHDIRLNDTDGYFVIGGGRYMKGVEGYFGPSLYYRNRVLPQSPSEVCLPAVIRKLDLTGWMDTCRELSLHVSQSIRFYSLLAKQNKDSANSLDEFDIVKRKDKMKKCELWEGAVPRYVTKIAKHLTFKRGGGSVSPQAVGRTLYHLSLHKLRGGSEMLVLGQILPMLLKAGCLGNTAALHISSVLYSIGQGVEKDHSKAWLLALLAAQKDHRLALLQLGHLHLQGLHGVFPDEDVAYAYYANIAKQTTLDRHKPSSHQVYVENIYLHDDEILELQTNEHHHIFQWLEHQAHQGVPDAEESLARMLFWGQQGVSPNIEAAMRHYERGAVNLQNPASMYDFAIVLLQGHGVEKDIPKGVKFLQKAMDKGFVPALSAMAWYYERFEQDYKKAVVLWEQADVLGNADAALNLGVVYLLGLYPGRDPDLYMAFQYFLKAAKQGHIRGAVEVAGIWSTGLSGRVSRSPSDAVLWAKWAAEQNGYLGRLLRQALDAFLKRDLFSSLFYYMMAAELGVAVAQFNVAYLCDQNKGNFLEPSFALNCKRRYYNLTVHNQKPDSYAMLRMGDMWYGGLVDGHKRLASAAEMYKRAALRNDPQGWYNLGLLVEEGYRLQMPLLIELGLAQFYSEHDFELQTALYKRCRDSENLDSYLPCSLALVKVYLQVYQKEYSATIKYVTTIVAAAPVVLLVLGLIARRALTQS
ncbi:protein sel-1 homolog 3-like [Corythoichthys intestinalis]|uniref:protein sel-1 homolog 3-like n=1 Tax=Corythoichthys intestinalis TaxID=161448 RepID=UPI0025A657FF|nr:protein sel-1 homolog 3-like [Corythoichthys intestinalis]